MDKNTEPLEEHVTLFSVGNNLSIRDLGLERMKVISTHVVWTIFFPFYCFRADVNNFFYRKKK